MKTTLIVLSLLLVSVSAAADDPLYLDAIMETPAATLQTDFPGLKKEGCYQIADGQYLLLNIDKDQKPWRALVSSAQPCRRAEQGPQISIRERNGVVLGETGPQVVQAIGRPDAATPPDADARRFGDMEYFYICRVSEGCARHISIFLKKGVVSAIAEWYSQ